MQRKTGGSTLVTDNSEAQSGTEDFLSKWHQLVANRDLVALEKTLADDVSMGAPPYWDKITGRKLVHHLLGLIINTIEDFTYHREWHIEASGKCEFALEFKGHLGEHQLQGIDLISLNERGEIQNLDVMIRPMNALSALRDVIAPQMMEFLKNNASESPGSASKPVT
jgi:hypothetical protein